MKTVRQRLLALLVLPALLLLAACNATTTLSQPLAQADTTQAKPTAAAPVAGSSAPVVQANGAVAALEGTLEEIYQRVSPGVVHIQVSKTVDNPFSSFPGFPQIPGFPNLQPPRSSQPPVQQGEGSGFVWDRDGHIVTNNHVVDGADKINVYFAGGDIVPATVVGADKDSDLAVLKVDVPADRLVPMTLADSTAVKVGELSIAIGNPFGQEGTMTVGFISAVGRLLPVNEGDPAAPHYNIPDVIQTDAAINPGNSGGVLLNDQGEVIGVTSAIISPAGSSAGIGFAIPTAIVQRVVPSLISTGQYEHPYLGISGASLTPDLAQAMELSAGQRGALVVDVLAGGPAEKAGLQGSDRQVDIEGAQVRVGGDVIVEANGQPVRSMDDLITILSREGQVGQSFSLTLLRHGERQQVEVTLAARPHQEGDSSSTASNGRVWLGILGTPLNPDLARAMSLDENEKGVLVMRVEQGSPADKAGLRGSSKLVTINGNETLVGGDVIQAIDGQPLTDVAGLQQALSQHQPDDRVTLSLLRDGKQLEVEVTLAGRNG